MKFVSNVNEGLWGLGWGALKTKCAGKASLFDRKFRKKILLEVTLITKETSFFSSFV